jgi:hypothetical protein
MNFVPLSKGNVARGVAEMGQRGMETRSLSRRWVADRKGQNMRVTLAIAASAGLLLLSGCKTNDMGDKVQSVGETIADGAQSLAGSAVSLVNVDLSNVLNDLSLDLKIDKSNIPINAQIPITVAANVCGVSINILSVATGGSPNCTANSISPELKQYIQQQLAANGSVGGGDQTTTGPTATTGTATTGTATPTTTTTTTTDTTTDDPQQPQ